VFIDNSTSNMKITKISIKNYRSCVATVFEPHGSLSALIGPNGSGKTNILSAIKLLPALCFDKQLFSRRKIPESLSTCEIKTWYEVDGKEVIHTAKLGLVTNEKNQDEIISATENWYLYDFTGKRSRVSIPSWALYEAFQDSGSGFSRRSRALGVFDFLKGCGVDAKDIPSLSGVVNSIAKISYYSASQFTNPASCPISFEVEGGESRRTGISISGHKKFLFDLYTGNRDQSEAYKEFFDLVSINGIGLVDNIEFNEIVTSSSNYSVTTGGRVTKSERNNLLVVPGFSISGNMLSPSQLSEGTFKTLALIFYLVTDKSPILLLEEPEVCVHHGLLSSIIELIQIYSVNKQIFISTHSDSVLDRLEIDNVFSVRRDQNSGTIVSNIKKKMRQVELAALKQYLADEGSLGEYWKHGDLENV